MKRPLLVGGALAGAALLCLAGGLAWMMLRPERRYVFIDGGAGAGYGSDLFERTRLFSAYPWEVFLIEANPAEARKIARAPHRTVIRKAMWVLDGMIGFNVSASSHESSLFRSDAPQPGEHPPMLVSCFDFSQWLRRSFKPEDFVILSLDIQGAEIGILDRMLKDDTIALVDRLYVEFHSKVAGVHPRTNRYLAQRLAPRLAGRLFPFSVDKALEQREHYQQTRLFEELDPQGPASPWASWRRELGR